MSDIEQQSIKLPPEMLLLIAKNLDGEEDCLWSGAFDGFASLYGATRQRHGLFISHKCFFLTPRSWNQFFTKHISPEAITNFSANSCYWLPGQQICDQILKMKSLQELAVKDTKVSLAHLATVLETCQDITKFDFSYNHLPGLESENDKFGTPAVLAAFKKLVSLKISSFVKNARDYVNDPWLFIIKMLSWCGDCVDLAVQITYTGESRQYMYFESDDDVDEDEPSLPELDDDLFPFQRKVKRWFRKDVVPNMDWMITSLQNLVFIKLGPSDQSACSQIGSRLLVDLFDLLLSEERLPKSLLCLWISDFYFPAELLHEVLLISSPLKAIMAQDLLSVEFKQFPNLEQISDFSFYSPLAHLPYLKAVSGFFHFHDRRPMLRFLQTHPQLEHFCVDFTNQAYVLNAHQLLKLKSFFCRCWNIDKQMVDEFVKNYPNIEALHLESTADQYGFEMDLENPDDTDCLSSICFPRLTSLSLQRFKLHDGAFLLPVIKHSPKLERIHLHGSISSISSFVLNLDLFFEEALKLKDFRLELESHNKKAHLLEKGNASHVMLILKSFLRCSSHLERISLELECATDPTDQDYLLEDFLVKFILKMKHLNCLSLTFAQLDPTLILKVRQRIVTEVLPTRPALWFHLDGEIPDGADPCVPLVHYHEMIHTNYFEPPPKL